MKKTILIFIPNYLFAGMWLMNSYTNIDTKKTETVFNEKNRINSVKYNDMTITQKLILFGIPITSIFILILFRNRRKTRY